MTIARESDTPGTIQGSSADRERLRVPRSKLAPPIGRPGTVVRTALLERLRAHRDVMVITVVAPPGYGKTTLVQQWAQRDERAVAWLTLDRYDNDPTVLLSALAVAVDGIVPLGPGLLRALAAPRHSTSGALLRLLAALDRPPGPAVLVLDDVHTVEQAECRTILTTLLDRLPAGWQIALVSRDGPPLPVARLRAAGRVAELGTPDLVMDDREAGALLQAAGCSLDPSEVAELNRRTEGWPVALYLAALAITSAAERSAEWPGGRDRYMVEYLQSEVLSLLPTDVVTFLTRTSLPPRLCGSLCDALLDAQGSADRLADLERANMLVIPLDHEGHWYRYHQLFRDLLSSQLQRREPGLVPVLRRRAADWYEVNDAVDLAIDEAMQVGDEPRVARLVGAAAQRLYQQGRATTVEHWMNWIDGHELVAQHPQAAVTGTLIHVLAGRATAAERWLDAAEQAVAADGRGQPDGAVRKGELAMLRAALGCDGIARMREDAELAVRALPLGNRWRPAALVLLGIALAVLEEFEPADATLQEATEAASDQGASVSAMTALAERALLAERTGHAEEAERLAGAACAGIEDAGLEDYATSALAYAVGGRVLVARGDVQRARRMLGRAHHLRRGLTRALPVYAVQARLELAAAYVSLTDVPVARTMLREAVEVLRMRPRLGSLIQELTALRQRLDALEANLAGAASLTAAELRLLPLLSTHLSFREVGERLFISPNTVKTEAISIYRKLGVSSRSEAVARARDLSLLGDQRPDDATPFIPSG